MSFISKASLWVKSTGIVRNNPKFRRVLRNIGITVLKGAHPNGVVKGIGKAGRFLMSADFAFSDFESWGRGHNNAFGKLLELTRGKNVVFDIGAHIGLCSMPISKVLGENAVCYAFEPSEANLSYLRLHLGLNHIENVVVVPLLIGDRCSDNVEFFESDGDSGMNSICHTNNKVNSYRRAMKEQTTIDHFVKENNCAPNLIKIDVEGSEVKVLSGAKIVLKRYHPEMILSVHPKQLKLLNHSIKELVDLVTELGYQFYNIDGSPVEGKLEFKEYYLN